MSSPSANWTPKQWEKCYELTTRGVWRHVLTGPQRKFYDLWKANPEVNEYGLYCSRKQGKTFTELCIAYELCMSSPKPVIGRIVLPELKLAKDVVYPITDELKAFMPKARWPRHWKSSNTLEFHNGSKIILGGASPDNIDGNRGPFAHFIICDEAGFWNADKYFYSLESVLYPQLTLTNGPVFFSTTPPEDMYHPFIEDTMPGLRKQGVLVTATIHDNPLLTPLDIQKIAARYGHGDSELGMKSKGFRREHMLEIITDNSRRVVPEWESSLGLVFETDPFDRKDLFGNKCEYVGYVSADYGVGSLDYGGIVSAFFDHNAQEIVVVGERLLKGQSITPFVQAFRELRYKSLEKCGEVEEVVDMFDQTRMTCRKEHNFNPRRPTKGNVKDTIAVLRNFIERKKIKIHSSCVELIRQLESGMWKKSTAAGNSDFERSEALGHLDVLVALAYLCRLVDLNRRPGFSNKSFTLGRR